MNTTTPGNNAQAPNTEPSASTQSLTKALDNAFQATRQMYELLKSYRLSLSETKQLDDTFQAFQSAHIRLTVLKNPPSAKVLTAMVEVAQNLLEAARNLQLSKTESDLSQAFKTIRTPYDNLVDKWNHERGLKPLELEHQLLLKRISEGGHSGEFLSDAFFSAYHRFDVPFDHCLGEQQFSL